MFLNLFTLCENPFSRKYIVENGMSIFNASSAKLGYSFWTFIQNWPIFFCLKKSLVSLQYMKSIFLHLLTIIYFDPIVRMRLLPIYNFYACLLWGFCLYLNLFVIITYTRIMWYCNIYWFYHLRFIIFRIDLNHMLATLNNSLATPGLRNTGLRDKGTIRRVSCTDGKPTLVF